MALPGQLTALVARPPVFGADMAPLANAPRTINAEFSFPYLAHAPMAPLNCTVKPAPPA